MNDLGATLRKGFFSLRAHGVRPTAQRLASTLGSRLTTAPLFPVDDDLIADSARLQPVRAARVPRGRPLRVGWVCTPPALGSGGHTTMFRMIEALEAAGHSCTVFLYDRYRGDLNEQRAVLRRGWPAVSARVCDARAGLDGVDALVATSWESAHVVASTAPADIARLYFVQDYEPMFYPRGALYSFAEDSYRFGFRIIALGDMIASTLRQELGIASDVVHFGCDTETYRLLAPVPREGVVCYVRPGNPRRGYDLARMALTAFSQLRPEVPIRVFGAPVRDLGFPAEVIPHLSPEELNALYNRSVAGLALSFTNVSLVPEELLRAGAVPVVNDCDAARSVLKNPKVVWARSTPLALAESLAAVVDAGVDRARAEDLSSSVSSQWQTTQRQVSTIIEDEVYATSQGEN